MNKRNQMELELRKFKDELKEEMLKDLEMLNQEYKDLEKHKEFVAVIPGVVKRSGTSAHIPFSKKYLRHEVRVLVRQKKVNDKKEKGEKEQGIILIKKQ